MHHPPCCNDRPLASGCTSLTSLNLGKAVAITAEAVRTLASTCPQLTVLELTIFSHGDEMLSHVAQFSAKLESLKASLKARMLGISPARLGRRA